MSLRQYNFNAGNVQDLQGWFFDIATHLDAQNYNNDSSWVPNITNLTGSPAINACYQRWGQLINFTIIIDGTSQTSSSKIDNLPIEVVNYGIVHVFNKTDVVSIGQSYVDKDTTDCYLPDWNVSSKLLIIQVEYRIFGI